MSVTARRHLLIPLVVLVAAGENACAAERRPAAREVIASTSMMGAALTTIAADRLRVRVLIPGGSCPGHYDLRPGDMSALGRGAPLFIHGYEPFAERLLAAGKASGSRVYRIRSEGSWMVPEVFLRSMEEIAGILERIDPQNAAAYRKRARDAAARVRRAANEAQEQSRRAAMAGKAVLCSDQQAAFLKWVGFQVAGSYGRAEEMTLPRLRALAWEAAAQQVCLVVDNLQSGPEAGLPMARELRVPHITLSNFPGGFPGTGSWELCFRGNVKRLLRAAASAAPGRKP